MFIEGNANSSSAPLGVAEVDEDPLPFRKIPLLLTEAVRSVARVYKHLTPNRVKTGPSLS